MKPKTIDEMSPIEEILWKHGVFSQMEIWDGKSKHIRRELIELFMSCVPEKGESYCIDNQTIDAIDFGWNDCRDQMIKNLEKLK